MQQTCIRGLPEIGVQAEARRPRTQNPAGEAMSSPNSPQPSQINRGSVIGARQGGRGVETPRPPSLYLYVGVVVRPLVGVVVRPPPRAYL